MSRLFTCGFEEQTLNTKLWSSAAGSSVTIVTTNPHSGTYHMRQPAGAANVTGPRRDLNSTKTSGTCFTRAYWNPATLPTSGTTTRVLSCKSGGSTDAWNVAYDRSVGFMVLKNN